MIQCRNFHHGKSIVKRWREDDQFFAIQRCRKCDVWERIQIDAFQNASVPEIKRTKIHESKSNSDEDVGTIVHLDRPL
jgi:hypothetical protein